MTQIIVPSGQSKCKRCGRWFQPKKPDQEYGPTCTRILAGQVQLDSMALISGKVLRKRPDPECKIPIEVCPGDCRAVIV